MRTINASDARTHLYSILDAVEGGETISITRNGKLIASIEPISKQESAKDPERARQAIENIRALRQRAGKVSLAEILSARDEGRR
jgi:prevent-host-death family protein